MSAVNITRKERERQGLLEYRAADVGRLLKNVVTGTFLIGTGGTRRCWAQVQLFASGPAVNAAFLAELKPHGAADAFIPGLPAYIIFMCVRYADCVNDEQRVSSLLNAAISSIKGVVKVTSKQLPRAASRRQSVTF